MKEIMEILAKDMTLEKALKLKESKKKMPSRWIKGVLVPGIIAMVFMATVMFCAVVITGICEGTLDVKNADEMAEVVFPMVFLIVGFMMGLLVHQSDNEHLVNSIIEPVIDKALEEMVDEDKPEDP